MNINEVIKNAFVMMRKEMLDTILIMPEEIRPNLSTDILYGVICNADVIEKIANKLEKEVKLKPKSYGVDDIEHTNW